MRNSLRAGANRLKNIVPCAVSVALGFLPVPPPGGMAACAGVFGACMGACISVGVGVTLATLMFEVASICIVDILGEVLAHVCFPSHMTVRTAENGTKRMDELQVGDRIYSGEGSSEVYLFSHKDHKTVSPFIELTLHNGKSVMASPRHFFPVSAKCDGKVEDMYSIAVLPGMCLYSYGHEQGSLLLTPVTKTSMIWSEGLFNPFTMTGQLIVNGVLASSHSDWFLDSAAQQLGMERYLPSIYQALLAPARWMYQLAGAETARKHLDEMQEVLNEETSANGGLAPYLEAGRRLVGILFHRATA